MRIRYGLPAALAAFAMLAPAPAAASFLSGDTLDAAATVLAWFVVVFVPLVAIAIFLFVHILPEKIAEKNHHPQQHAIKTLCMLSLFFGGMLWPLAWLWAYTRPVGFRAVYGTEKHENYFLEMAEKARQGELDQLELEHLKDELREIASRGALPKVLQHLPDVLAQAKAKPPIAAETGGSA